MIQLQFFTKNVGLIRLLFVLLLIMGSPKAQAQTHPQTPYEQKISSLYKQFLLDIGIDFNTAQKASRDANYANSIAQLVKRKMESNSLYSIGVWNEYKTKLEDAKKLMNATEKEKDRLKTVEEKRKENAEKEQEDYIHSDAYNLKIIIQEKYKIWTAKGEFEKTSDYQSRMENKQSAVRDIIIKSFQDYVSSMGSNGQLEIFKVECSVANYYPDKELLGLMFVNKRGVRWIGAIQVSPEKAKQIKSRVHTTSWNDETLDCSDAIKVIPDKCSLVFYNNNLTATKIGIKVEIRNGFEKHYEYPEIMMKPKPDLTDLGENFFTTANLNIDMSGNENLTLNDINVACKEIAGK